MEQNPYESPLELNEPPTETAPPLPVWLDMFYLALTASIIVALLLCVFVIFAVVLGPLLWPDQ